MPSNPPYPISIVFAEIARILDFTGTKIVRSSDLASSVVVGDELLEHFIGCLEVEDLARPVVQSFGDRKLQ